MGYDGKYGKVTTEHGDIGEDEPVIIFRAKDKLAPQLIMIYKVLCREAGSPDHHLDLVSKACHRFIAWQEINGKRTPTSDSHKERLGL